MNTSQGHSSQELQGRQKRRPYGTPDVFLVAPTPTLKRGANQHCAYGAGFVGAAIDKRSGKSGCWTYSRLAGWG